MAQPRPLSPHLQVYRPQLTSVMSIMHRGSGAALAAGSLLLAVWLMALAMGSETFSLLVSALQHPLGRLLLFSYSLALVYHGLNGIRHLSWDFGIGLEIKYVYHSGYFVLALTCVITAALWLVAWI